MTPRLFYAKNGITLWHGRAEDVLPTLEAGSVDAVVTDPPYNIGSPQRISDLRTANRRLIGGDFGTFDTASVRPDVWMPLVRRTLKDTGVLVSFYGARNIHNLLTADPGFEVVQDFHWCKTNPPVPMRSVGFSWATESGYVFRKLGQKHRHNNDAGISPNWFISPICGGHERTAHATQKPLGLMVWLLQHWSFDGQLVCDPFFGSGTTACACLEFGRRFVGVEVNEAYAEIAARRLDMTTPSLFTPPVVTREEPDLFAEMPDTEDTAP